MRSRKTLFLALFTLLISAAITLSMVFYSKEEGERHLAIAPAAKSFALIELFTSEGCSSCPSADKLLGELYAEYHGKNQPVFALAFHVDYWDYLGWKDDFSKKEFSQRQNRYGEVFNLSSIYTPQMVVNGAAEFVGSDRTKSREAIQSALSKSAPFDLALSRPALTKHSLTVSYSVSDVLQGMVLNFALVERGITHSVLRGENGGRKLQHENVVRSFKTIQPDPSGEIALEFSPDVDLGSSSVVAYLQKVETMEVVGAANIDLAGTSQPEK